MRDAIIGALLIIIALLALDRRDHAGPEAMIEDASLHRADFPACVTIHPEPLLRTPSGRLDYRLGKPSNDRGDT